jgi:hypothetical protein
LDTYLFTCFKFSRGYGKERQKRKAMIDKFVVKGNFNKIKSGMLVEIDSSKTSKRMPSLPLEMAAGEVGLVLETTYWETELGDDQTHLSPVILLLVKGKKLYVIPEYLREVKEKRFGEDITVVNYSTHNLPVL